MLTPTKEEIKKALSKKFPSKNETCYDCGSTIAGHHTASCDFSEKGDLLTLNNQDGCQYWTRELPEYLNY